MFRASSQQCQSAKMAFVSIMHCIITVTLLKLTVIYFACIYLILSVSFVCVYTGLNSKIGGLVWQAYFSQSHFQMS